MQLLYCRCYIACAIAKSVISLVAHCRVMDSQVGMLSARPLHCASGAAPFAAQYQPTPSIVLRRQVDDDRYHVGHVTWTGYPGPRYDVISPQYVYGQRPASSSIRAPCGQLDPGGVTVVTADQWSYAAASQPPAPSDDWRSSSPAAIAAWSCSDDRLFSHTTRPHGLPSAAQCAQLRVPRNPSADGVIPAWRFDGSERRSAAETTSNFVTAGDWTTQRTTLSPHHHLLHHHQLSYVSPLSQYQQPSHCDVSSSSRLVDDDDCDDHSSHRFGSKPTRASTSVGTYSCTASVPSFSSRLILVSYCAPASIGAPSVRLSVCPVPDHKSRMRWFW